MRWTIAALGSVSILLAACASGGDGASDTNAGRDVVADVVAVTDAVPVPVTDTATDTVSVTDTVTAADSVTDTVTDTGPLPDVDWSAQGCCHTDEDCLLGGQLEFVCRAVDQGAAPGWGVCVPRAEPGRCWSEADCPGEPTCDFAGLCGCGLDCDMAYEGPGVCRAPGACSVVDPDWVLETCDAADVVVFTEEGCVATGPGCCGCEPFCELVFYSMEACLASCGGCAVFDGACDDAIPDDPWWYFDGVACREEDSCVCAGCPGTYLSEQACLAACVEGGPDPNPYSAANMACGFYRTAPEPPWPDTVYCMGAPCAGDGDCDTDRLPAGSGERCVFGSCVHCWDDAGCADDRVCRAGRCVLPDTDRCNPAPPCEEAGCHLVSISEVPCPVCVCDSVFGVPCAADADCQILSSHPYAHCVYGRCAECRNDDECGDGDCLAPGLCFAMDPHPRELQGTWLLGWSGGMDHYSYVRFEHDGTLRRGHYEPTGGAWSDDVPPMPCWPDGVVPYPLLGTWEPEVTASGALVVRMSLNTSCDGGDGWTARYLVGIADDGRSAGFEDLDSDGSYLAFRALAGDCLADFSLCSEPSDFFYRTSSSPGAP